MRRFVDSRVSPAQLETYKSQLHLVSYDKHDRLRSLWHTAVAEVLDFATNREEWFHALSNGELLGLGGFSALPPPLITLHNFPEQTDIDIGPLLHAISFFAEEMISQVADKRPDLANAFASFSVDENKIPEEFYRELQGSIGRIIIMANIARHLHLTYLQREKEVVLYSETGSMNPGVPFVDLSGNLYLPFEFFMGLDPRKQYLVLIHEAMHLRFIDPDIVSNVVHSIDTKDENTDYFMIEGISASLELLVSSHILAGTIELAVDAAVLRYHATKRKMREAYVELVKKVESSGGRYRFVKLYDQAIDDGVFSKYKELDSNDFVRAIASISAKQLSITRQDNNKFSTPREYFDYLFEDLEGVYTPEQMKYEYKFRNTVIDYMEERSELMLQGFILQHELLERERKHRGLRGTGIYDVALRPSQRELLNKKIGGVFDAPLKEGSLFLE